MKKTIYLKDNAEAVLNEAIKRNKYEYYSKKLLTEAIEANIKDNLRYNINKGITYNNTFGKAAEYVDKTNKPTYETEEQAAVWEFTRYVRNSAQRKLNGYTII